MGLKKWLEQFKTQASIYLKNPKRFPDSKIETYVPPTLKIGQRITVKPGVYFSEQLKSIGDYVYIGDRTTLLNVTSIGSYSSISHNVKIGLDNHKLDALSTNPLFYDERSGIVANNWAEQLIPAIIESDVLISADVTIISGVKLNVGCVVGANSFVNKDVPPYAIVAGSPAKVIGYRFEEETIEKLIETQWWLQTIECLKPYEHLFNNPTEFIKEWNKRKS